MQMNELSIILLCVFIPVIIILCLCLLIAILLLKRKKKSKRNRSKENDLCFVENKDERTQKGEKNEVEIPLMHLRRNTLCDESNEQQLITDKVTFDRGSRENIKYSVKESCLQAESDVSTTNTETQATVEMKDACTQTYEDNPKEIQETQLVDPKKKMKNQKKRSRRNNRSGNKPRGNTCFTDANTDKVTSENKIEFEHPKGNRNLGNTCFFNSSLQALYFTKSFKEALSSLKLSKVNWANMRLTQGLLRLLEKQSEKNENHTNELKGLLSAVQNINSQFGRGTQEDSYELLNTLLGGIFDEMKQAEELEREEGKNKDLENEWKVSNIKSLFSGLFITVYVYESCNDVEVDFEEFTTLSIPIVEEFDNEFIETDHSALKPISLLEPEMDIEKGLAVLTQIEEYEESDLPCRLCSSAGTGKLYRRLLIYQPPPILIMHIDRFKMNDLDQLTKNAKMMQYPRTLSLAKFCSVANNNLSQGNVTYELYAVVVHSGGINGGHYYAFVNTSRKHDVRRWQEVIRRDVGNLENLKSNLENVLKGDIETKLYERMDSKAHASEVREEWFYVSDEHVHSVSSNTVLCHKDAYILFYEIQ